MSKKILIIENDPIVIGMYKERFEALGYEVASVDNQDDLLERAKTLMPNIILLNTNMPIEYKLEVLKNFKKDKLTKKIPVIFITSTPSSDEDTKNIQKCGATACVPLDPNPIELINKVKELLGA